MFLTLTHAQMKADEDKRVADHARRLGVPEADLPKLPRKFWRLRGLYLIPEPRLLYQRLMKVYEMFSPLWDPLVGRPFLIEGHRSRWETEMWYVVNGFISDPPADANLPPMYVKGRVCKKTGFQFHECKRGSPRLEGSFLHTALVRKVTAMNASPEWLDAIVNEHDFRVVVKALRKRDLLPAGRHYDLQLLDMLYDLIPAAQREAILGKWVRTKYDPANPPQLRHGLHFGRESLQQAAAAAGPPAVATPAVGKGKCAHNCRCGASPSVILHAVRVWCCFVVLQLTRTGLVTVKCMPAAAAAPTGFSTAHEERFLGVGGISFNTTWEDILAIMNSVVASGKVKCDEVSKVALARQLLLSVDEAERLVEKKLQDEQVWALLRQRRYREFQQWLRKRVPEVAVGTLGVPHTAGAGAGGASASAAAAASPPQPLPLPRELFGAAVVAGSVDPRVALTLAPVGIPVAHSGEVRKRARDTARMRKVRAEDKAAAAAGNAAAAAAAAEERAGAAARMRELRAERQLKKRKR